MKPKILIADDDEGIRDILAIIFTKAGYSLEMKMNGDDLFRNKFTLPDLFLLDKQLSGVNGLDVCRFLKSQERTMRIPVIMISASPDIASLSKQHGADAYIEKPFEISYLLNMVSHYIGKSNSLQNPNYTDSLSNV